MDKKQVNSFTVQIGYGTLAEMQNQFRREALLFALWRNDGNKSKAAGRNKKEELGLQRTYLTRLADQMGIKNSDWEGYEPAQEKPNNGELKQEVEQLKKEKSQLISILLRQEACIEELKNLLVISPTKEEILSDLGIKNMQQENLQA